MQPISKWFAESPTARAAPWLVLGKGPTFSRRGEFSLAPFRVLGMTDVAAFLRVDLWHFTDLAALERLPESALENVGAAVGPAFPHVNFSPRPDCSLQRLLSGKTPVCRAMPRACAALAKLDREGRLYAYKSSRSGYFAGHPRVGPTVRVRYFSAVAAVNLLATNGVKVMRTLGVDGGAAYAGEFGHLKPLANGRPDFDAQFKELDLAAGMFGLDLRPLAAGTTSRDRRRPV